MKIKTPVPAVRRGDRRFSSLLLMDREDPAVEFRSRCSESPYFFFLAAFLVAFLVAFFAAFFLAAMCGTLPTFVPDQQHWDGRSNDLADPLGTIPWLRPDLASSPQHKATRLPTLSGPSFRGHLVRFFASRPACLPPPL